MARTGRPHKTPGGMNNVLYIRISDELLEKINSRINKERDLHPGRVISKADVVREILELDLTKT